MPEIFLSLDVPNIFLQNRLDFNHRELIKLKLKLVVVLRRISRSYIKEVSGLLMFIYLCFFIDFLCA